MLSSIQLKQAVSTLHRGGVIAYPTEAVYGLGCDPSCHDAVQRIIRLKGRDSAAGFILLAADFSQLEQWANPSEVELGRLEESSEHPLTWIVTASASCPDWITGGRSTVAVRVTKHPVAAMLSAAAEMPLVSTSANRSGRSPIRTALGIRRQFGAAIDLVVPGETSRYEAPSEIRFASSGETLRSRAQ